MRKAIILSAYWTLISFISTIQAQTTVQITSPDVPASDGPSAPVSIVAQADPTNPQDCLTFKWVNVTDGGNLGTGTVTGSQSTLLFTPSGSDVGSQIDIQVQVTDSNDGSTDQYDITIIVPQLTPNNSDSQLSYYGGTAYNLGSAGASGGPYTNLRVDISPNPYDTGASYSFWIANDPASATVTSASSSGGNIYGVVSSSGGSQSPFDTNVSLSDDDSGNPDLADSYLNIQYPQSNSTVAINYSGLGIIYYIPLVGNRLYKGWETDYVMSPQDQFGQPLASGTPINESFGTPIPDFVANNWLVGFANSSAVPNNLDQSGQFTDGYSIAPSTGWYPQPIWESDFGGSVAVYQVSQHYAAGSLTEGSGAQFDTHTLYFDYGLAQQQ